MNILIAIITDAETISENNVEMAKETEDINLSYTVTLNGVKNLINDKNKGFYLLAKKNDEIIGQLMITYEWSDWRNKMIWWIQSVYIKPTYRKQGVFHALYTRVKKLADNHGINLLRLYVHRHNQLAISVYNSIGMKKTSYQLFEAKI
ncbi:MAG: GNAT family N-acetyltransferase [Promethearchaeota archaeon]|jgi:ribosomal protein S18 acetylase RimI-like enzyme